MYSDKRKAVRRPMRYTAWIAEQGKELRGCALADISDTGARLNVEHPEKLPNEFVLFLSSRGSPRRKCKVAWRSKMQLGVQFDFPLSGNLKNNALAKMLAAKRAREKELTSNRTIKENADEESVTAEPI